MFVRWQKKGNRKYAHLEERKRVDGKVVTVYIAYLGVNPRNRLSKLLVDGVITNEQYEKLTKGLPPYQAPKPKVKPPKLAEQLKTELDKLTEKNIMAEFLDSNSNMTYWDGVQYMLKKIDAVKAKFPELWPQ